MNFIKHLLARTIAWASTTSAAPEPAPVEAAPVKPVPVKRAFAEPTRKLALASTAPASKASTLLAPAHSRILSSKRGHRVVQLQPTAPSKTGNNTNHIATGYMEHIRNFEIGEKLTFLVHSKGVTAKEFGHTASTIIYAFRRRYKHSSSSMTVMAVQNLQKMRVTLTRVA